MLRRLLTTSAGHFWRTEKFEDMSNPDYGNIKNLQIFLTFISDRTFYRQYLLYYKFFRYSTPNSSYPQLPLIP